MCHISAIAIELLVHIFKYLSGRDMLQARKVCDVWRRIVHTFFKYEPFWEMECARECLHYGDMFDGQKISQLPWMEHFNSVLLWPRIAEARLVQRHLRMRPTNSFYLLPNNKVSCPQRLQGDTSQDMYDAVVHYSLRSLKLVYRRLFEFQFKYYYEDADLLVLEFLDRNNTTLRVIPKFLEGPAVNAEDFYQQAIEMGSQWVVYNRSVYFQAKYFDDAERMGVFRYRLARNNFGVYQNVNELLFTNTISGELEDVHIKHDRTFFLFSSTFYGGGMAVVVLHQGDITHFNLNGTNLFDMLKFLEFKWWNKNIFSELYKVYEKDPRFKVHDVDSPFEYGPYVITATTKTPTILKIFHRPYDAEGNLILDRAEPVREINLEHLLRYTTFCNLTGSLARVTQIAVLEIGAGHKIVMLYCRRILLISMRHFDETPHLISVYEFARPEWFLGPLQPTYEIEDDLENSWS